MSATRKIVAPNSLGQTLCNLNTAQILSWPIDPAAQKQVADFIASRQGLPGSYAGMFAPTSQDFEHRPMRLATGETLTTGAALAHIAGEESCRALLSLGIKTGPVTQALKVATTNMVHRLGWQEKSTRNHWTYYCCGKCTVSVWRNLLAGGLNQSTSTRHQLLDQSLAHLKRARLGNGRWRVFPFYYTLLALTEMPYELARPELSYAAPVCQRLIKRKSGEKLTSQVQFVILQRALKLVAR